MLSFVAFGMALLALVSVYALAQGMNDIRTRLEILESPLPFIPGSKRTWVAIVKVPHFTGTSRNAFLRKRIHIQADTEAEAVKILMASPHSYTPDRILSLDPAVNDRDARL